MSLSRLIITKNATSPHDFPLTNNATSGKNCRIDLGKGEKELLNRLSFKFYSFLAILKNGRNIM